MIILTMKLYSFEYLFIICLSSFLSFFINSFLQKLIIFAHKYLQCYDINWHIKNCALTNKINNIKLIYRKNNFIFKIIILSDVTMYIFGYINQFQQLILILTFKFGQNNFHYRTNIHKTQIRCSLKIETCNQLIDDSPIFSFCSL